MSYFGTEELRSQYNAGRAVAHEMFRDERTWVQISASALEYNISQINRLAGSAELGLVVKSEAYGHGMLAVAQIARHHPAVKWFCVASMTEALALRAAGVIQPILVMAYYDAPLVDVIAHDIRIAAYDMQSIVHIHAAAKSIGVVARVHLKVETGLIRFGVMPDDLVAFCRAALAYDHVVIEGVFSHLADVSSDSWDFTREQMARFDRCITMLRTEGILVRYSHIVSSGALPLDTDYSLVRVGTNLLGLWKGEVQKKRILEKIPDFSLRPIMQWKTHIAQLKHIPAGTSVGYNRTCVVQRDSCVAILPIGYADGYSRSLSNKGVVEIHGFPAPVLGIINMNMTVVDVTNVPNVQVGDEVMLVGGEGITAVNKIAEAAGTINNEFTTRIAAYIPRVIVV